MKEFDRKQHWESIYQSKQSNEVSWFQPTPETSLAFIKQFNVPLNAKIIDVGGGDSLLVDHLLKLGYQNITVLDISESALSRAKQRLSDNAGKINWIVADASEFEPTELYDFWHDRAAFHFLTEEKEIENYFEFLSDPFLPKLLTLLSFEDITPTAERFAKIFDCNKDQILKSLTKLKEIGLAETIEVDGELHWRSKNKNFKVSDKFGDIAMKIFHENSFQDAIKSFHKPKDLRRFRSLLLPMDAEEKEELLKMLEQFAAELITRFRSDQYQSRQLFQVNLNFFPVAEPAETASK